MSIVIAIASIMIVNEINSPSWVEMIFQFLFIILALFLSAPNIANELIALRRENRNEQLRKLTDSLTPPPVEKPKKPKRK